MHCGLISRKPPLLKLQSKPFIFYNKKLNKYSNFLLKAFQHQIFIHWRKNVCFLKIEKLWKNFNINPYAFKYVACCHIYFQFFQGRSLTELKSCRKFFFSWKSTMWKFNWISMNGNYRNSLECTLWNCNFLEKNSYKLCLIIYAFLNALENHSHVQQVAKCIWKNMLHSYRLWILNLKHQFLFVWLISYLNSYLCLKYVIYYKIYNLNFMLLKTRINLKHCQKCWVDVYHNIRSELINVGISYILIWQLVHNYNQHHHQHQQYH